MKQIIRVEHPDNEVGIFRNNLLRLSISLPDLCYRHNDFNSPAQDRLDLWKNDKRYFCAYKSIEQLQEWIKKSEIILLNKTYGFDFLLLEVTDYQEGRDQILFTRESIVSRKNISEILIN